MDPGPLVDGGGAPVYDGELYEARLSLLLPVGPDWNNYTMQLATGPNTTLWKTQDKQALPRMALPLAAQGLAAIAVQLRGRVTLHTFSLDTSLRVSQE